MNVSLKIAIKPYDDRIITISYAYHKDISFKMARNDASPLAYVNPVSRRSRAVRESDLAWSILEGTFHSQNVKFHRSSEGSSVSTDEESGPSPVGKDSGCTSSSSSSSSRVRVMSAKKGVKRRARKAGSVAHPMWGKFQRASESVAV